MNGWEASVRAYAASLGLDDLPISAGRARLDLGNGESLAFDRFGESLLVQWVQPLCPGDMNLKLRMLRLADRGSEPNPFPYPLQVAKNAEQLMVYCRVPLAEADARTIAAVVELLMESRWS